MDLRDTAEGSLADMSWASTSELFRDARVLIVDDLASNVLLLERMLSGAGIGHITSLTDPRLVGEHCQAWGPDLILLDLHMPHMDGVTVLNMLQAILPEDSFVPTLVLTADATPAAKEQALIAGAKDFVTKPFERSEVLLRVRNLLETRALYVRLQQHRAILQSQLDRRMAKDRRAAAQRRVQLKRIKSVLRSAATTSPVMSSPVMSPPVMSMVFQPICELDGGAVVGMEALARFDCTPRRPPNEWFAEADDVGLGIQLETLAVDGAVAHFEMLSAPCFMALNVSPATATSDELDDLLTHVPCDRVVLEITEHSQIDDYIPLVRALDELRGRGVRIAVDDAGVGYAGLQHILRLKPDIIKLDLELTHGVHHDPARRALALSMVRFAADIGAQLVAEGIETKEDLDVLRDLGIRWGQGYHLARPAPLRPGGAGHTSSHPLAAWSAASGCAPDQALAFRGGTAC